MTIKMNSGIAPAWVSQRNRRVHLSNMCMCTATNRYEFSLEVRLDALRRALSLWPENSPERKQIIDQVPVLAMLLQLSDITSLEDTNDV